MKGIDQADRLVIFAAIVASLAEIVRAIEYDLACLGFELCLVEQGFERHASPFTVAAPPFHAVVPGDLRSRWHAAQLCQRKLERLADETADLKLPIGESVGRECPV